MGSHELVSTVVGAGAGLLVGLVQGTRVYFNHMATPDSYFTEQLNNRLDQVKATKAAADAAYRNPDLTHMYMDSSRAFGAANRQISQIEAQLAVINETDPKRKHQRALGCALRAAVAPALIAGVPLGLSAEAVQALNPGVFAPMMGLFLG